MILLNVIYFKDSWRDQFDPSSTKLEPFYYSSNYDSVKVPTMKQFIKDVPYLYLKNVDTDCIALPYKVGKIIFYLNYFKYYNY